MLSDMFHRNAGTKKTHVHAKYSTAQLPSSHKVACKSAFLSKQTPPGSASMKGTILIKGDKFQLETLQPSHGLTGKTQWSYLVNNQEVNISNPTQRNCKASIRIPLLDYTNKVTNTTSDH